MKWKYYVGSGIGTFSFIHLVGLVEDISPVVYKGDVSLLAFYADHCGGVCSS